MNKTQPQSAYKMDSMVKWPGIGVFHFQIGNLLCIHNKIYSTDTYAIQNVVLWKHSSEILLAKWKRYPFISQFSKSLFVCHFNIQPIIKKAFKYTDGKCPKRIFTSKSLSLAIQSETRGGIVKSWIKTLK